MRVHVLLDWVGSLKMEQALVDEMKKAGVQVERFHEPEWSQWNKRTNRTHRKQLVVDGRIGYTGGVVIADHWRGQARNPQEWRDSRMRVTSDVLPGEAYLHQRCRRAAFWLGSELTVTAIRRR